MKPFLIILCLLPILSACQQPRHTVENEASAICAIYTPANLKAADGMSVLQRFDYVNTQLREAIKSQEMKALFEKLAKAGDKDFYAALQKEISALLGKEWVCEDAKAFYGITWQRADQERVSTVIQISVVNGKFYQIDGINYEFADVEQISQAINSAAAGNNYKLELSVPSATSREEMNTYLEPLKIIGIKKLSIIEK